RVVGDERLLLGHPSPNFDRTGWLSDPNVVFPLQRLRELEADGTIGSVANHHFSFGHATVGAMLTTMGRESGPAVAALLREDDVDVVLLTPVSPYCTRTGSVLAHALEARGLATVQLASTRSYVERMRPPRSLYCEFPFGRPLGKPGDAALQHRV